MDNEVCYYVYNKERQEAEATTVKVEYETKCEEETQKVCPEQQYGHKGYCKTVKNQVGAVLQISILSTILRFATTCPWSAQTRLASLLAIQSLRRSVRTNQSSCLK